MELLLSGQTSASLLAAFADGLLADGDPAESAIWLRRLEKLEPESPRTLRLRVLLRLTLGKNGEATDALDRYVFEARDSADRQQRLAAATEIADEASRRAGLPAPVATLLANKAEGMLRDWAVVNPAAGLRLAKLLARRGQIDDAIDQFEPAPVGAELQTLAATADALAGASRLTLPQVAHIRALLEAAKQQSDSPLGQPRNAQHRAGIAAVWVSEAQLDTLGGDYRRAESDCRQALEIVPTQVSAAGDGTGASDRSTGGSMQKPCS